MKSSVHVRDLFNKEFCLVFDSFLKYELNWISVFRLQVFQVPLSVLFVFPVQALTDTFNYSFRCLVETKVPIFSSRSYNTYSLKTSSYLLCYVN